MNIRIEIKFFSQPQVADAIGFTVLLDDVAAVTVEKIFAGLAAPSVTVAIGGNLAATLANLQTSLQTYNAHADVAYSVAGNSLFADIVTDGTVEVTDIVSVDERVHVYVYEAEPVAMFNVYDFTVEIIDTYENTRELIEEFTRRDSLKLDWDGGDDVYAPMMPSKMQFSLMAPRNSEGHFLHLLTGDEMRYLVKLKNTDAEGNTILLWQGYILPDLYSEPYKNGVHFVEFTAIDMLASLKNKTFEKWFYFSTFNLPQLLGYILEKTGLAQEIYVTPTMVCISHPSYEWRNLNMSLEPFWNDGKPDSLYDILENILLAQGMQISSFRGKWFLTGITRRGELSGDCEVYHPDGIFKGTVTLEHNVVAPAFNRDPLVTAETPWKKVKMNFTTDSDDNLFPDDVVITDAYCTAYDYGEDKNNYTTGYYTKINAHWNKVGAPMLFQGPNDMYGFYYTRNFTPGYSYNVSEASALVNYFECRTKPYLVGGRRYELEIEVDAQIFVTAPQAPDWAEPLLKSGHFDKILNFQFFVDGIEYISNRPSFVSSSLFQFTKEQTGNYASLANAAFDAKFTLKWEFEVPQSGEVTFRFLPALGVPADYNVGMFEILPQVLSVKVVGDIADIESAVAVRGINYTKEFEQDVKLTCTVDSSVKNSFGIGQRISGQYATIPTTGAVSLDQYHFFPNNNAQIAIELNLTRWPVSQLVQDIVFRAGATHTIFVEKADGTRIPYGSLYTKTIQGVPYMAAYHGFNAPQGGKPRLPKDYEELPELEEGDVVKIMLSLYNVEDRTDRELWKIYGFDDATALTYMKTLAHACHAVRPDVGYSIEGTALKHLWPTDLVQFSYLGLKNFVPTRLSLDLFAGKTGTKMQQAQLSPISDINFE